VDSPRRHPLRRHTSYLLRELAFTTRQFPDALLINRSQIKVNLTVPEYAGGTGYVYRGQMGDRAVAVKEIKVVEKDQYVSSAWVRDLGKN
jgi:hypothetical protein